MILTGAEWQAFEPVCSGTRPRPAAHRPSFGSAAQSRRTLQSPCAARYASSLTSCASQAASCCWLLLFTGAGKTVFGRQANPVHPCKSATENRLTVGNEKAASTRLFTLAGPGPSSASSQTKPSASSRATRAAMIPGLGSPRSSARLCRRWWSAHLQGSVVIRIHRSRGFTPARLETPVPSV